MFMREVKQADMVPIAADNHTFHIVSCNDKNSGTKIDSFLKAQSALKCKYGNPKTSPWCHTFLIFTFQVHGGRRVRWSLLMQLSGAATSDLSVKGRNVWPGKNMICDGYEINGMGNLDSRA